MAIPNDNYLTAWKLLHERYEDTNELIDHHVSALFRLSSLSIDSTNALRQLIDDFTNNVQSLKSLQELVDRHIWKQN